MVSEPPLSSRQKGSLVGHPNNMVQKGELWRGCPFDMVRHPQQHTPGQEARWKQSNQRAKRRPGRVVSTKWFKERRNNQGIQGIAEGQEGCPFDTERHPTRP